MRFHVLACDYDGTIAREGRVDAATLDALRRLAASGRKLVLVTGRRLDDLQSVFPEAELFDRIVAENGAVIHDPAARATRALGPEPSAAFVEELERRGVRPLSAGHVIVATWEPQESVVLGAIRDLGLELPGSATTELVALAPAVGERRRHRRKYAEGELGPDKSFYFRGPDAKLNLRAHNLLAFVQMAEGVDDETWLFHLHNGDLAAWFSFAVKDDDLAKIAREARTSGLSAFESRARLKDAIEERYTLGK